MKNALFLALAVLLAAPAIAGASSVGLQIKPSVGGGLVFVAFTPEYSTGGYLRLRLLLPKGQKLENPVFKLKRGGADWIAENYLVSGWKNTLVLNLPALDAGELVKFSISSDILPLSSFSALAWFVTDNAAIDHRYNKPPVMNLEHAPLDELYMQAIK